MSDAASLMRTFLRRVRRIINVARGTDFFVSQDVRLTCVHLGSEYGGWNLATDGLNPDSVIYSAGLGEDASFDLALTRLIGADIHVFDPTPRSIAWAKTQNFPASIKLHEVGVADFDGVASFAAPANSSNISHSIVGKANEVSGHVNFHVQKLSTLMRELGHSRIDVLKLDIEGAEYSVLSDLQRSDLRPLHILVEYHHRFPTIGVQKSKESISQLHAMGYKLYMVSASGEEFSFIHRP